MTFLSPSRHTRLNEAVGLLLFLLGLGSGAESPLLFPA